MIARKMVNKLDSHEWKVVVIDKDQAHYYQPGFLFVPFGVYKPEAVVRPKKNYLPRNVEFILADVEQIQPKENRVLLAGGRMINYDYLVIATGTDIAPEQTEGLLGGGWRQNVFDFYTYEGAVALSKALQNFNGGRLVMHISEMPIKCPVAPLEFIFLADWYLKKRGIRNKTELVYATPLPGAFTKPVAAAALGDMLTKKGIHVEAEYNIMEVDSGANVIRSYDEREIPYDLLVTVPVNMGAGMIQNSGLGDDLNYVPTNKYTMQSDAFENIFVMGDAANIPASKAGSVIHFQMETVVENLLAPCRASRCPPNSMAMPFATSRAASTKPS
jgi:sulfide:quinone oxidoreductase